MRIVIDMQGAQSESRFRGIGRYTLAFTQAIVRNRGEHEIILALSGLFPETIEPVRAAFYGLLPQENIRVWYAPGPVCECESGNEWRRLVAELIREAFLASLRPDIVHISSLFEGYVDDAVSSIGRFDRITPVSVSLYDLIPLLNPDHYLKPNRSYEHYYYGKIDQLKMASMLLAISDFSRQEGLVHLGLTHDNVVNISTAADSQFRPIQVSEEQAQALKDKFGLNRSFVLYTGGCDERKNLPRLIKAYALLAPELRNTHQLVLAGKMPEDFVYNLRKILQTSGVRKDELIFTGYVSDHELVVLYNLCKLFVFPSWHEGFGLPALEAMACGAPVIGANVTSVPEVIARADALFDPLDLTAIKRKLVQVLEDDCFRTDLAAHGLEQAKRFSWDSSARLAIAAFEQLKITQGCGPNQSKIDQIHTELIDAIAKVCPADIAHSKLIAIAQAISHITSDDSSRRLFVDISELSQRDVRSGIQRVTRSILKELLDSPPEGYIVEPVFATVENRGYRYARAFSAKFQDQIRQGEDDLIEYYPGDIFLGLDLQHHTILAQSDYLTELRSNGVRIYFVVYDLLLIQFPHFWPSGHSVEKIHHAWLDVISQYDGAVCISRTVADELAEWVRKNGSKRLRPFEIRWFHLGADVENSVPTKGVPDDANHVLHKLEAQPSFLTVGTLEPRKCHDQILAAFELLWEQGVSVNLVIVGKEGWLVESLVESLRNHPELDKHLFWLEGISDEYLEKVYTASTCLIAGSAGEGFGLPLIEAAQHKLPIIARDIPVFREVAGEYASYFSGNEPQELADAIAYWLTSYELGTHPSSHAMPWLNWKESAKSLLCKIINLEC